MKISVALCTCNGERYLPEQLQSVLEQSRLPDEVIACDDASSDGTIPLLQAFRAEAPFPVMILPTKERMGSTRNFERALRHCTGDLIALSDQDDRWRPQRLTRSLAVLEQRPYAALLFADGTLIDEASQPMRGSLWQRFGFAGQRFHRFAAGDYSLLCRDRFITGATVMLRRSALAHALPIPAEWVHDAWLGILLSFQGELIALDEALIDYRIHPRQQVGAAASRWRSRATRQAEAHWARIHLEHLQAESLDSQVILHPPTVRSELLPVYAARLQMLRFRDTLPTARIARATAILRHLEEYSTQTSGVASGVKDWLFSRTSVTPEAHN